MLTESLIRVCADPVVDLLVAQSAGPADQALLVLHGGPDWDHTYLVEPLSDLGGRYRLVMPDLRGCGGSTRGLADDQYTPDAAVDDLITLLDRLSLPKVDLLGFSYGGLLAQRLTLAAPARVRRLIVASSSIYPVPDDAFGDWPERDERLAAEAGVWEDPSIDPADLARVAAIATARANVWREAELPAYLERISAMRFSAEWLKPWQKGTLPSARPPNAAARLAELGVPILLLHGAQDMTFPVDLARRAAGEIPAASAVVLEEAGHMTHVDQPDQWLLAVDRFLAAP
jgi:pimeloyl-ACP methyl ester carboxylesterase